MSIKKAASQVAHSENSLFKVGLGRPEGWSYDGGGAWDWVI